MAVSWNKLSYIAIVLRDSTLSSSVPILAPYVIHSFYTLVSCNIKAGYKTHFDTLQEDKYKVP